MSIISIENEKLRVSVDSHGSELVSVYDKENGREVMWQADPAFWNRHAPVLFPNVGKYYGGEFRYNGKAYKEGQHGFARDSEFTAETVTDTGITYVLNSSEATKSRYPFDFKLSVTHMIEGNQIRVTWRVENTGSETMYFTIGGHPAFRVPALEGTKYSDYYIAFREDQDELQYMLLDTSCGCVIPGSAQSLKLTDHKYQIRDDMFDIDTYVFDDSQITYAAITYPDGKPYVEVSCEGFPNFGIWAKPGASFVCLEPWAGRCDDRGFDGDISEKKNISRVAPSEFFEKSYTIKIN